MLQGIHTLLTQDTAPNPSGHPQPGPPHPGAGVGTAVVSLLGTTEKRSSKMATMQQIFIMTTLRRRIAVLTLLSFVAMC